MSGNYLTIIADGPLWGISTLFYLLQAGERIFSLNIHSTWEEPCSAALYKNADKGVKNLKNFADGLYEWSLVDCCGSPEADLAHSRRRRIASS